MLLDYFYLFFKKKILNKSFDKFKKDDDDFNHWWTQFLEENLHSEIKLDFFKSDF